MLDESHVLLCCVERLQNKGLTVKLHDLKLQQSSEVSLTMKTNGQMVRLSQDDSLAHQLNYEFRDMVYRLSFSPVLLDENQRNLNIVQSFAQKEDQLIAESRDPMLAEQQILQDVTTQKSAHLGKVSNKVLVLEALKSHYNPYARHHQSIESFKQLQERGLLLYRDVKYIQVSESLATQAEDERSPTLSQEGEHAVICLCSFHIRDSQINIEIFMFNNQKVSVSSIAQVEELFSAGGDPSKWTHSERAKQFDQILEKLFVEEIDQKYEMRVRADAGNVSEFVKQCLLDSHAESKEVQQTQLRNKIQMQRNHEDKTREFQMEKNAFVQAGRAVHFSESVTVGELRQVYELKIYVLLRKEKKDKKGSGKRLNTFGKTQLQIEIQKLEQFIDDHAEFEQIYLETADPHTQDLINLLIDKKRLVQVLVKDMTIDWAALISDWKGKLIPLIKYCIQINLSEGKIVLRNKVDISNLVISQC